MDNALITKLFEKFATTYEDISRLNNQKLKPKISKKYLEKFENDELLISATTEGFSKDALKSIWIYMFESVNLEKISNSLTFNLIKPFCKNLDSLTAKSLYDFLDSKNNP